MRITMNNLPRELVDDIIGHVDEDDISHFRLLACSLVCRFWLPSIQRRLFHHVNLTQPRLVELAKRHAQIQRLDQVLLNSPHLISYIRVLELPDLSISGLSIYHYPGSPGWTAIDKPLPALLRKLTHVQKLKISDLAWSVPSGDFRQSLCQVLELPSMAFVCINDALFYQMDDFTNLINHARGLTGLSLNLIDVIWVPRCPLETKQGEDNDQRFEGNGIHLASLDVLCGNDNSEFISGFINWLLGPRSHFGVSHIHTLHIALPDTEDDSVNRLLCAIGSSLKHVSIIQPSPSSVFVNLAFNVNIETLSLVRMNMRRGSLSTLRRVLSTIDASNHIHRMELRINDLFSSRDTWVDWEEVYSVLTGPHFQFLRVLYINIRPGCDPNLRRGDPVVGTSKGMVAGHPLLAIRWNKATLKQVYSNHCIFCPNNPWN
ncbi:hypothetical protein JB92DRAFT_2998302 [Gautieria morchelliformis]|nr:hypothetical protein JB92DRAFT_2998302 [Gautieria morchelliformis]